LHLLIARVIILDYVESNLLRLLLVSVICNRHRVLAAYNSIRFLGQVAVRGSFPPWGMYFNRLQLSLRGTLMPVRYLCVRHPHCPVGPCRLLPLYCFLAGTSFYYAGIFSSNGVNHYSLDCNWVFPWVCPHPFGGVSPNRMFYNSIVGSTYFSFSWPSCRFFAVLALILTINAFFLFCLKFFCLWTGWDCMTKTSGRLNFV
jgi:hypothetical protein